MLTYAIGDVHGCLDKLVRLLARCRQHGGGEPSRLVFVGDYIDRGPDSRGVIETLLALQREQEVIYLRGNHEAMVLDALETSDHTLWLRNGGHDTLASYGVTCAAELPGAHLDWIAALRLTFDDGRRLFVHAGVNPSLPLDRQDQRDLVWIREPFLSSRRDYGRLIVHGHTPLTTGLPDHRANRLNIDTAAVFGGPLTAAVFADARTEPIAFLTDDA
jgi:diadenosine tetraphosphatase ApaH/serine/threonine PP2A family protein phosphatase